MSIFTSSVLFLSVTSFIMNSIARVGIIGYFGHKRRHRQEKYGTGKNAHLGPYRDTLASQPKDKLEYSKNPWAAWVFGVLFLMLGLFLLIKIATGHIQDLFPGGAAWWEYLLCACVMLVSLSFFVAGTSEHVQFDREINVVVQEKVSLFCTEFKAMRNLDKCNDIEIVKKGFQGKSVYKNDTTYYELIMYFEGESPLEILETNSRFEIKQRYLDISHFLGREVELAKIEITNLTRTSNGQKKRKGTKDQQNTEESYQLARI